MELLFLFSLVMLNGIFAMSEIALVTARKAKLLKLAADGDKAATVALKLGEDPTSFMSTIQIGITSIGVLSGIVGEAVLAAPLSIWLQGFGLSVTSANFLSTAGVVLGVTYISIVVGELVPKRIGQITPEPIACLVARPIQLLALITHPFVLLLSISTHTLLQLLGIKQNIQHSVTEEEIQAMLDEGSESGVLEQQQHEMMRNVFRLDDRQISSLMVPRSEIVFLDIQVSREENLRRILDSEHSRFPVCAGSLDHILGVIHAKQVLATVIKGATPNYETDVQPGVFVPETLTGMDLLEQFRANTMQMAFVIDEYGDFEGIVTLQDVLEALTGKFVPQNAEDAWAVQREDGSWLLDGSIPILEMKDRLLLKSVPEEAKAYYHTISGMVMLLLGHMPTTGEYVDWLDWRFEVVDMDGNRIDKVLATPKVIKF